MRTQSFAAIVCISALFNSWTAHGDTATEIQQIREEMRQMREDYEKRLRVLEQKLERAEQSFSVKAEEAERPKAADKAAEVAGAYERKAGASGRPTAARPANPAISAILQGTYADYSSNVEPEIPGFILGPETELRPEGFSLRESEINLEANVDDKFRAWLTVGLENEEGETKVEVEEAYVDTLAFPAGFGLKFGRFFSDIGYQNRLHNHSWDFVDAPLPYRAMLANQLRDDGLQLRWVAPTDLFVELGTELLRGDGFPAGGEDRSGVNAYTLFAHIGGDWGMSSSWRLGLSQFLADADGRETGAEDSDERFIFNGDSDLSIVDFVWKWAPQGNPTQRNFVLQAEYFYRDEDGDVGYDDGAGSLTTTAYDGTQQGLYIQGVYQFIPKWRVGARYDWLTADNDVSNNPNGEFDILAQDSDDPKRYSLMVDWSNSEFARFRLQYNRDESRPDGETDDQVILQYIHSIGSHGAHEF